MHVPRIPAIALLFVAAPYAIAAASQTKAPPFAALDVDHNHAITRSEIPSDDALLRARFASFDRNRDNALSANEFAMASSATGGGGTDFGMKPNTFHADRPTPLGPVNNAPRN